MLETEQILNSPPERPKKPVKSARVGVVSITISEDAPRVRKRPRTVEEELSNDSSKRARGRPRLNTEDETAADRRRTQIRVAQRAYRHRKDTAITTLEQKVKDLEDANESMSKAFKDFSEFALSQGNLTSASETSIRLQGLTETFNQLGRRPSDDQERSGSSDEPRSQSQTQAVPDIVDRSQSTSSSNTITPNAATSNTQLTAPENQFGLPVPDLFSQFSRPAGENATPSYEVVVQPTPENASYPFHAALESHRQQQYGNLLIDPLAFPLLSPPVTYSPHELSFSRHLHRKAVEAALGLVSMSSPPPDQYAAVFGFCLLFESREEIRNRLVACTARDRRDDLYYWQTPFAHLGRGREAMSNDGQYSPSMYGGSAYGFSNMADHDYARQFESQGPTGQWMGPFDSRTQSVADNWLGPSRSQMRLPGFEGTFLDPASVDKYLQDRGIVIPPQTDIVEADVDFSEFMDPLVSEAENRIPSLPLATSMNQTASMDKNFDAAWSQQVPGSVEGAGIQYSQNGYSSVGIGGPGVFYCPIMSDPRLPQGSAPNKRKVRINVPTLIDEIIGQAICLSRSPGVRAKHVKKALKVAIGIEPPTPRHLRHINEVEEVMG